MTTTKTTPGTGSDAVEVKPSGEDADVVAGDAAADDTESSASAEPGGDPESGAAAEATPDDGEDDDGDGKVRRWRVVTQARVFVLVVVVLLGAGGFLGYEFWRDRQLESLRTSALADAREYATRMATYDYNDPDANTRYVESVATNGFRDRYASIARDLRELLVSGQGTARAEVVDAAVAGVDTRTATVLVFLDQHVTNRLAEQGRVDASRLRVSLVREDGRWKLDDAQIR